MTLNKQLINLLGILLLVVVLVLGVALIGMPMFAQAQTINANADSVDQSNAVYQTQIDALSAADDRIDEIDRNLAELRSEIAAAPKLDDIHEIVDAAAETADIRIESVVAGELEQWTPRTGLDADGNPVAEAAASTGAADAASTEQTDTDSAVSDAAVPETTAPAAPGGSDESPQMQVLVTVTVDLTLPYALPGAEDDDSDSGDAEDVDTAAVRAEMTADAQKAAAFVDALGAGPRLLSPINLEYSTGKLTLSVLTFTRTEG
ncbi:hypothetical protein [Microbacterium invictum]|uniref:Cytoskeletal protein RodZ n=1 Tax=Microbacterium invictum TaxID=515415 RepID=A0AA40SNC7_9MICO|nr:MULTISPECIES: hypothetical protein [Microbacterium]MBB4139423.1 cytoskeletal protein RodZ [Microbacterium invictum]